MRNKTLKIQAISAFEDNYIWLLHYKGDAIVVDPGSAEPVISTLSALQLELKAILVTHHHSDHIGGVAALIDRYTPTVYAPQYESFDFEHIAVKNGDLVELPEFELSFDVLWLPGHTLGHIAYLNQDCLFCGDVLFGAGCGRLFEGTAAQMLSSLTHLKELNPQTKVFCAHEYTAKNIAFALEIEPDNQELLNRQQQVNILRRNHQPSLPSTIATELLTNPFLRCLQPAIAKHFQAENNDELAIFSMMRAKRNHY